MDSWAEYHCNGPNKSHPSYLADMAKNLLLVKVIAYQEVLPYEGELSLNPGWQFFF